MYTKLKSSRWVFVLFVQAYVARTSTCRRMSNFNFSTKKKKNKLKGLKVLVDALHLFTTNFHTNSSSTQLLFFQTKGLTFMQKNNKKKNKS